MTSRSGGSNLVLAAIEALQNMEGKSIEAGWYESARYPDGTPVAAVAKLQNFGGKITIKGKTVTIFRVIDEKTGEFKNKGRFVKKDKANWSETHAVKDHVIEIPARPFMSIALFNFNSKAIKLQKQLAQQLFSGKITADQLLGKMALALEGEIVRSIKNFTTPPNAPSTIQKKGFNKPLIDTGHMWQTVSSKVSE